jgi:uncharacterized RDD family membrane protein YckC
MPSTAAPRPENWPSWPHFASDAGESRAKKEDAVFCTHCGVTLPEGAEFCPRCGTAVKRAAPQAPMSPAPAPFEPAGAPSQGTPAYTPTAAAPVGSVTAGSALGTQQRPIVVTPWSQPYAGFWRRFVALVIDSLILYIVTFPVHLFFHVNVMGWMRPDELSPEDLAALFSSAFRVFCFNAVVNWLYFALLECSPRQATLGKMALNIRVTTLDGRRITFARASGRYFAKFVSGITFLIGYVMAAFTKRRQALHDIIAQTLVLKSGEGA